MAKQIVLPSLCVSEWSWSPRANKDHYSFHYGDSSCGNPFFILEKYIPFLDDTYLAIH